ncbi:MAG: DNA cytosine methyltransferase, partial [Promethearchaeota archaeon]
MNNRKKKLTFIDLFSGAGGWSEGFKQLGFKCVYSVDNWKPAVRTHTFNHVINDIDESPKDILHEEVIKEIEDLVREGKTNLILGSPPCTAFSFANKGGKGNIVEGMVLVRRFFEVIDIVQNKLKLNDFPWIMENVPRLKNFLKRECVDNKNKIYRFNYISSPDKFYDIYIPKITILNAADYGAPTKRRRVFCGNFEIPKITNISPDIKSKSEKLIEFINKHEIDNLDELKPWRTLRQTLCDLPDPLKKPRNG